MNQTYTLTSGTTLFHADCRDALRALPDNCIDAVVTDPPYGLQFMGKEWDKLWRDRSDVDKAWRDAHEGTLAARARKLPDYSTMSKGVEMQATHLEWAKEAFRVLKPGGHMVAFSASRTYHRMACAIEDAGFEIRDSLMWLYGTGFPKSHDVSKGIDKTNGVQVGWFGPWLKTWRAERGIAQKDIAELFPSKTGGKTGCVANWELGFNLPTPEQFNLICTTFGLPFDSLEAAEREVIGQRTTGIGTGGGSVAIMGDSDNRDVTAPKSPAAQEWEGWGTALKPSFEPIVLARKPLSESTVAANVLRWRTGALNIGACRVESGADYHELKVTQGGNHRHDVGLTEKTRHAEFKPAEGRWPANVVHDGSAEVVEAFPQSKGQHGAVTGKEPSTTTRNIFGLYGERATATPRGDAGSAARFFYSAKASKADRAGSKHPTVKPIALMQWLARLVTPPGGVVLDPFAGSGTTGAACAREGFRCVLVEREAEYVADICERFASPPISC